MLSQVIVVVHEHNYSQLLAYAAEARLGSHPRESLTPPPSSLAAFSPSLVFALSHSFPKPSQTKCSGLSLTRPLL
eukprot:104996-Pleurochrysis_carterae.AAC.5